MTPPLATRQRRARCSPRVAPSCLTPRASVPACVCARPHRAPASILLGAVRLQKHHKPFTASPAARERSPWRARQHWNMGPECRNTVLESPIDDGRPPGIYLPICAKWAGARSGYFGAEEPYKRVGVVAPAATVNGNPSPPPLPRPNRPTPIRAGTQRAQGLGRAGGGPRAYKGPRRAAKGRKMIIFTQLKSAKSQACSPQHSLAMALSTPQRGPSAATPRAPSGTGG